MGLLDNLFNLAKDTVKLPFAVAKDVLTLGEDKETLKALARIKDDIIEIPEEEEEEED